MHDRLLEMGRSLPSSTQSTDPAVPRDTYTKEERVSDERPTTETELTEKGGGSAPDSSGPGMACTCTMVCMQWIDIACSIGYHRLSFFVSCTFYSKD